MLWPSLAIQSMLSSLFMLAMTARAYIPAVPANVTAGSRLDTHDNSLLYLKWSPNGGYKSEISYQLAGADSTGVTQGALIQIKEEDILNNDTTTTPWIALINCDKNATNASMETDIFTMVQEKGAIAALLYSTIADGCLVNLEYLYSGFDRLFDIFTAKKSTSAKLILSQYSNINSSFATFNPTLLNSSYELVTQARGTDTPNNSSYLVAILKSYNATSVPGPDDGGQNTPPSPASSTPSSTPSNTSTAMIVLYVIVSIVAALFTIVILSGAIRAFRHPERYGPRLYDPTLDGEEGQPQTRAAGITRAILDTFPVVKFGARPHPSLTTMSNMNLLPRHTDVKEWDQTAVSGDFLATAKKAHRADEPTRTSPTLVRASIDTPKQKRISSGSRDGAGYSPDTAAAVGSPRTSDIDPAAIGTETCPICIVDFEEGDDLRVLPCEGKHRFHKDCVDPWLLELSSSCPICRQDFQALETMANAAGTEADEEEDREREQEAQRIEMEREDRFSQERPTQTTAPTPTSRFLRYMHLAQRKRRSQRDSLTASPRLGDDAGSHPYAHHSDR